MKDCIYKEVCTLQDKDTPNCETSWCNKYRNMKYLLDKSGIPEAKQKPIILTPEDVDLESFTKLKQIKDDIYDFVQDGKSLYIYSNIVGNGKTSWSLKILMHYFETVYWENKLSTRGMFVSIPTLLVKLKDFNNPLTKQYLDDLVNADVVVFDEMGDVPINAFDSTHLLSILEQRKLNEKSNIFTSNLSIKQLNEVVGPRICSRVNDSVKVELRGGDRRNG